MARCETPKILGRAGALCAAAAEARMSKKAESFESMVYLVLVGALNDIPVGAAAQNPRDSSVYWVRGDLGGLPAPFLTAGTPSVQPVRRPALLFARQSGSRAVS